MIRARRAAALLMLATLVTATASCSADESSGAAPDADGLAAARVERAYVVRWGELP